MDNNKTNVYKLWQMRKKILEEIMTKHTSNNLTKGFSDKSQEDTWLTQGQYRQVPGGYIADSEGAVAKAIILHQVKSSKVINLTQKPPLNCHDLKCFSIEVTSLLYKISMSRTTSEKVGREGQPIAGPETSGVDASEGTEEEEEVSASGTEQVADIEELPRFGLSPTSTLLEVSMVTVKIS